LLPSCLAVLWGGGEAEVSRGGGEERIGLPKGRVAITGPRIEFRFLDQLGFEGIAFDVSAGLKQIGILHDRKTLVAALPEMAGSAVGAPVVPSVCQLKPLQGGNEGLRVLRVKEQMDVVGHEAIVVTAQGRGFREKFVEEASVDFIVRRLVEYRLPIIAACKDMIGSLWGECACGPRHLGAHEVSLNEASPYSLSGF